MVYDIQLKRKWLKWLAIIILLAGIIVRIAVYLQNRNLFIDEANLARNINERGFKELLFPLSYEQYAPPLFLWMVKICALLFGYGEYALRLYPLLAGIAALFLLFFILKQLTSYTSLWYPLFLMATGFIFIRYSSELKQYMCDVFIVLSLIWLALKTDIQRTGTVKFVLLWLLAGSVAIWACMPAVFALAGVGAYYFCISIQQKKYSKLIPLGIIGALWLAQFVFYYITILKPQADSSYLQNFHQPYFLFINIAAKSNFVHDVNVLQDLLDEAGGHQVLGWAFNLVLLASGAALLFKKHTAIALLIVTPIAGALIAASFRQYSLIPRVALFMLPLILILIGCGLERLLAVRSVAVRIVIVLIAIICMINYNKLRMIYQPWKNEEITEGFAFLKSNNITGDELYVHNGARPAYIYYTQIHPARNKWAKLDNAHLLWWDANYDSLSQQINGKTAFIYTSGDKDDVNNCNTAITKYRKQVAKNEDDASRCYVYIYSGK